MVFAVVVLIAGGLAGFFVWIGGNDAALDPVTLCPTDRDIRSPKVLVILFDQTDQLTNEHRQALRSHFRRLIHDEFERGDAAQTSRFSRIEVYSFRAESAAGGLAIERQLAVCNPGDVDGLTKFTKNPGQVRRNFEQRFLGKIDSELADLLKFKESPASPLFEAIKYVALKVFADPRYDRSGKHLVLVSDMLNNTKDLSMFQRIPPYAEFRRTSYAARVRPELRGVAVRGFVLLAKRIELQGKAFLDFWRDYFLDSGASPGGYHLTRVP